MIAGIHCRPAAIDRSPDGHRWPSGRSSAGHQRGIGGASAENLVISRENRPVTEQSPGGDRHVATGWFTTLFKVKKIGR